MVSTKTLTDLNTQGLMLLSQQRFDEAAWTFRACLAEIREHLKTSAAEPQMTNSPLQQQKPLFYEAVPVEVTKMKISDSFSPLVSYDKGFMIVLADEQGADDSKMVDEHLFSAAVLCNLGLTFFLRGNAHPDSRRVDYKRSITLYNMSLTIHRETNGGSSLLLQLALHNNLARIHLHNYDVDAFETSIEWMKELLYTSKFDNDEELTFFSLNIVVSDGTHCFRLAEAA
eukprot:scaffold184_cov179-Amphora_coffeaeformis.AAC.6